MRKGAGGLGGGGRKYEVSVGGVGRGKRRGVGEGVGRGVEDAVECGGCEIVC